MKNGEDFREMTEAEKSTVMSNEDAQNEANRLRALTFQRTDGSPDRHPVSKEEYDEELTNLEKMMDEAENETNSDKARLAMIRIKLKLQKLAGTIAWTIDVLTNPSNSRILEQKDRLDQLNAAGQDIDDLKSYSQKLKELQERAERYENMPTE